MKKSGLKRKAPSGSRAVVPSSRARTTTVPRGVGNFTSGFPKQLHMIHKYTAMFSSNNIAAGGYATSLYSCNNMTKPDVLAPGHQPMYFDQLTALYDQYTVLKSSVVWTVACDSNTVVGTSAGVLQCVAYIEDDATVTPTNFEAFAEQPSATRNCLATKAGENAIMRQTWDARKQFGGDTMDNSDLRGNSVTGPAETQNFVLIASAPSTLSTVYVATCTITYHAVWTELKNIANS